MYIDKYYAVAIAINGGSHIKLNNRAILNFEQRNIFCQHYCNFHAEQCSRNDLHVLQILNIYHLFGKQHLQNVYNRRKANKTKKQQQQPKNHKNKQTIKSTEIHI